MNIETIYQILFDFYNSEINKKKSIFNSFYNIISINFLKNKDSKSLYFNINEINKDDLNVFNKIVLFNQENSSSIILEIKQIQNIKILKNYLKFTLKNKSIIKLKF